MARRKKEICTACPDGNEVASSLGVCVNCRSWAYYHADMLTIDPNHFHKYKQKVLRAAARSATAEMLVRDYRKTLTKKRARRRPRRGRRAWWAA